MIGTLAARGRGRRAVTVAGATSLALALGELTPASVDAHPDGEVGREAGPIEWIEQPPGQPGPEPPVSPRATGIEVLGHNDVDGQGFNADVVAHRGFAYMGSWGAAVQDPETGDYPFCPAQGVNVFDLSDLSDPTLTSTFADGDEGDGELFGTWTEKVVVERFRGQDIAVVSIQNCREDSDIFRGWGLWDVTDPRDPQRLALVPTDERTQGSHEIWLERRGRDLFVYTAVILSELDTAEVDPDTGELVPGTPDFQIWDVSDPTDPAQVGEWGAGPSDINSGLWVLRLDRSKG